MTRLRLGTRFWPRTPAPSPRTPPARPQTLPLLERAIAFVAPTWAALRARRRWLAERDADRAEAERAHRAWLRERPRPPSFWDRRR